eukprot:4563586-Amphidinium_carterae.1
MTLLSRVSSRSWHGSQCVFVCARDGGSLHACSHQSRRRPVLALSLQQRSSLRVICNGAAMWSTSFARR